MKISICIKAFNEAEHIADAISSAIRAVNDYDGEVIVADCGSTDETVPIAQRYPVHIVRLDHCTQRSCGVGAQLGFQHARGDYVYVMDGDMQLDSAFLEEALVYLDANPHVAGVGGTVVEAYLGNLEFQIRQAGMMHETHRRQGLVDRLEGGGLYRHRAIADAGGYYADRNLHSFEEFELGVRLQSAGWQLARINQIAARHFGHTEHSYVILWRRLTSKYAYGAGEVLRAAIYSKQFKYTLRHFHRLKHLAVVIAWWLVLIALAIRGYLAWSALVLLAPMLVLALRRRSASKGLYSFATWNVYAVGFVLGLFQSRQPPGLPIPGTISGPGHSSVESAESYRSDG